MNELTLPLIQSQLTAKQKLQVTEETVDEINKLANNPDYGPEFLEAYLDCLNVFAEATRNDHKQYLNAMKFFSLVEADNSLTDSYIKVFPERYERRRAGNPGKTPDQVAQLLRGEASRYNKSRLLCEIRRVATIPVQLVHRHLLHEAILQTAHLMTNAKSEMVRQKAADTLIRELKPSEDQTLKVEVNDGAKSVIAELHKATKELAAQQRESIMAGVPIKQIAAARIFDNDDEDVIDVETN
jgi:hypothetical protein